MINNYFQYLNKPRLQEEKNVRLSQDDLTGRRQQLRRFFQKYQNLNNFSNEIKNKTLYNSPSKSILSDNS